MIENLIGSSVKEIDIDVDIEKDESTNDGDGGSNLKKPPRSSFKQINRSDEDMMVSRYQKTKDKNILEQLYELREPTLQIWARRYAYLGPTSEDVLSDVGIIWLKCIDQYEYKEKVRKIRNKKGNLLFDKKGKVKTVIKRTPFNTFLYTALRNYMSNVAKRRHSKKRVDAEGRPLESTMVSLDREYDVRNSNSSDKSTLYDVLVSDTPGASSRAETNTLIEDISKGDNEIREVLAQYVADPHIRKISSACKYTSGSIRVGYNDHRLLKNAHKKTAKKRLKEIIDKSGKYTKNYVIVNFALEKGRVINFEIRRKDTYILRKTRKALDKYKQKLLLEDIKKLFLIRRCF